MPKNVEPKTGDGSRLPQSDNSEPMTAKYADARVSHGLIHANARQPRQRFDGVA
jgi:hypothetical protein